MLSHSSFGTGCLLLVVVLTLFGTTFGNPTDTSTKRSLLSSFAQSKVLSMGVLDQNLLIITKDSSPMVYEVPMANYPDDQINLYGVVPVDLKDKWPVLSGNDNFTKGVLNSRKAQSFSIGMDKATLISVFRSDNDESALETVTFTLKPPSATYRVFKIDEGFNFKDANLISSNEPNVFFNLKITNRGKNYQLNKFAFNNSNGFNLEWEYSMCKSSNGNDSVVFNLYSQCSFIDWKIENGGFVYLNRFHLFAKDQVYIFDYPGAGNSSEVGLKVIKLTDFFTTNPKVSISSIFFIVTGLIVLVASAVGIWIFFFKKSAARKEHDQNSVSGEMKLQPLTPKERSNVPSNPTNGGAFGNVYPRR